MLTLGTGVSGLLIDSVFSGSLTRAPLSFSLPFYLSVSSLSLPLSLYLYFSLCVSLSTSVFFSRPPGSPGSADPMLEAIFQEKLKGMNREASDKSDKYKKCKQMLSVSSCLAGKTVSCSDILTILRQPVETE